MQESITKRNWARLYNLKFLEFSRTIEPHCANITVSASWTQWNQTLGRALCFQGGIILPSNFGSSHSWATSDHSEGNS